MTSWAVVVPAKRLAAAKTRLRPVSLAISEAVSGAVSGAVPGAVSGSIAGPGPADDVHARLVLALLADTVTAARACPAVAEVVVVTDDPDAAAAVRAAGARTVPDLPDRGLNPALDHGARSTGADAVAALSSDLPALRPDELAAALAAAAQRGGGRSGRAFVPDAAGTGTTLLTARGTPLDPRFGPGSAAAHRASGAVPLAGEWPGLSRDVDTPDDLRAALRLGVGRSTAAVLAAAPAVPAATTPHRGTARWHRAR